MSIQKKLEQFHKKIKVETAELREKRDIITKKIKDSLSNAGHPPIDIINQGSYIYGVGVVPLNNQEYDIDVGIVFSINPLDHQPKDVRDWVYNAIANHTNSVEQRGACIRVRYAAGYHVDLVVYAKSSDDLNNDNYQLARSDGIWSPAEPKKLKKYISDAREKFISTKDCSGADQLQRITRYLKRWHDIENPEESPNKPSGLATLLLVIQYLPTPILNSVGNADDLQALISITKALSLIPGRICVKKPTQQYEDVYEKLSEDAMVDLKERFSSLLSDLEKIRNMKEIDAVELLQKQFGSDFSVEEDHKRDLIQDMETAIPSFQNPSIPWAIL